MGTEGGPQDKVHDTMSTVLLLSPSPHPPLPAPALSVGRVTNVQ